MSETSRVKSVVVTCPRCNGEGKRESWHPDDGICYRCKGSGEVTIWLDKYEAALGYLRAQYCSLRIVARTTSDETERRYTEASLKAVLEKGLRLRAELDAAKSKIS